MATLPMEVADDGLACRSDMLDMVNEEGVVAEEVVGAVGGGGAGARRPPYMFNLAKLTESSQAAHRAFVMQAATAAGGSARGSASGRGAAQVGSLRRTVSGGLMGPVPSVAAQQREGAMAEFFRVVNGMRAFLQRGERDPDRPPTHVALNNGSFCVPPDREREFLAAMAAWLSGGNYLWLCERLTPAAFRFFVDLDLVGPAPLAATHLEAVAVVAQRALRRCFGAREGVGRPLLPSESPATAEEAARVAGEVDARGLLSCVLCASAAKQLAAADGGASAGGGALWKSGAHLTFTHVFLDAAQALAARAAIVRELQGAFGPRLPPSNSWADAVDEAVYANNGLRMVGNRKIERCPVCHGASAARPPPVGSKRGRGGSSGRAAGEGVGEDGPPLAPFCECCGGKGKVDGGRPYWPLLVLDGDGGRWLEVEAALRANTFRVLWDTRVRQPEMAAPPALGFQSPSAEEDAASSGVGEATTRASGRPPPLGESTAARTRWRGAAVDRERAAALLEAVRLWPRHVYHHLELVDATVSDAGLTYHVRVEGHGSRYCHRVGREHKSNHVYFVVTAAGVHQRCFDPACKGFKSDAQPLSLMKLQLLFPAAAARRRTLPPSMATHAPPPSKPDSPRGVDGEAGHEDGAGGGRAPASDDAVDGLRAAARRLSRGGAAWSRPVTLQRVEGLASELCARLLGQQLQSVADRTAAEAAEAMRERLHAARADAAVAAAMKRLAAANREGDRQAASSEGWVTLGGNAFAQLRAMGFEDEVEGGGGEEGGTPNPPPSADLTSHMVTTWAQGRHVARADGLVPAFQLRHLPPMVLEALVEARLHQWRAHAKAVGEAAARAELEGGWAPLVFSSPRSGAGGGGLPLFSEGEAARPCEGECV